MQKPFYLSRWFLLAVLATALLSLTAIPAVAQSGPLLKQPGPRKEVLPPPADPLTAPGRFEVHFENDLWGGSDKNYTNGARFTYYGSRAPGIGSPYFDSTSLSLGQLIFTPDDLQAQQPLPDQRPYGGWLYLELTGYRYSAQDSVLCLFTLDLGVTGEPSLAEQVQKLYHDFSDIEPPRGWDNQIDTEPGIILSYERRWKFFNRNTGSGWGYSGLAHGGLSLGNILTQAKVGGQLRAGFNMTPNFGFSTIQPGVGGWTPDLQEARGAWGFYAVLGLEGRAVARNIFLDGSTFSDSLSVDKNVLVGDVFAGIGVRYKSLSLSFTETLRSKEFQEQNDPQPFGALTVSWEF